MKRVTNKIMKIIAIIMMTFILTGLFSSSFLMTNVFASSQQQITKQGNARYYNDKGAEITNYPQLGNNSVVSVKKSINGTGIENEFLMTLDVKTSVDIKEVKVSADAAVVLVLDVSGSMANASNVPGYATNMDALRVSVNNFLDSYVESAGDASRYASVVVFGSNAQITMEWTDLTNLYNLIRMKESINKLVASGSTNAEGGLQLARNLLRKEVFPNGQDGNPIENRSIIMFTDGEANTWTTDVNGGISHPSYEIRYDQNRVVYGGLQQIYPSQLEVVRGYTTYMSNIVKNSKYFTTNSKTYEKYDAYLYTIAFGDQAPSNWLRDSIATNSSFAYSAKNAGDLSSVFAAISKRIESWAQAWVVTDPMGLNMEFAEIISPNDIFTGLLKFENNVLSWDLKKANPDSYDATNKIYTYTYNYLIRLDTTSNTFFPDISFPTNGDTKLTYVMTIDNKIVGDVMTANFDVPLVKGYDGVFGFIKVGGNTEKLTGCVFELQNQTTDKLNNKYTATSANVTGAVGFSNIPSGHKYKLKEISMPQELEKKYYQSDEELTVEVAYGKVIIKDKDGKILDNGFTFNNPSKGKTVTGNVFPVVPEDKYLGPQFAIDLGTVVELRATYLTPATGNLSVLAKSLSNVGDGEFTFEEVPIGEYVLYIKRPGYLTRAMNVSIKESDPAHIELTPPGSDTQFKLWAGDVNDNGVIEALDIQVIVDKGYAEYGDGRYLPSCDLNGDGVIDAKDIQAAVANRGKENTDYEGASDVDFNK